MNRSSDGSYVLDIQSQEIYCIINVYWICVREHMKSKLWIMLRYILTIRHKKIFLKFIKTRCQLTQCLHLGCLYLPVENDSFHVVERKPIINVTIQKKVENLHSCVFIIFSQKTYIVNPKIKRKLYNFYGKVTDRNGDEETSITGGPRRETRKLYKRNRDQKSSK